MKKGIVIFFILFFRLFTQAQYNSDYIQYMFNGLLLNPAYAGSNEALDATLLYRKQWVGIEGAPATISFGAHAALKNRRLNAGLLLQNDKAGLYDHTRALGIYAYRLKIKKGFFSMGVQLGVDAYSYNWSALKVRDENDPNFAAPGQRENMISAGAGVYYHNKKMYVGFSAPEMLQNDYGTMILTGGGIIPLSQNVKMKPVFILKYLPSADPVVNVATTFYFRQFLGIGAGYTVNNSVMMFLDLAVNDQLRFGYGFAHPLTRMNVYTPGTHEIMLRYLFKYKIKAVSPRYF